jgi:predicted metalloendopeptidase
MKYVKSFNESSSQRLYKYLGETNSPIWANNIRDILENKIIISNKPYLSNDIEEKHLVKINTLFSTMGFPKHVLYKDIESAHNCRFGNCWFFYSSDRSTWGPG